MVGSVSNSIKWEMQWIKLERWWEGGREGGREREKERERERDVSIFL
jgi:hypothetical protein